MLHRNEISGLTNVTPVTKYQGDIRESYICPPQHLAKM